MAESRTPIDPATHPRRITDLRTLSALLGCGYQTAGIRSRDSWFPPKRFGAWDRDEVLAAVAANPQDGRSRNQRIAPGAEQEQLLDVIRSADSAEALLVLEREVMDGMARGVVPPVLGRVLIDAAKEIRQTLQLRDEEAIKEAVTQLELLTDEEDRELRAIRAGHAVSRLEPGEYARPPEQTQAGT